MDKDGGRERWERARRQVIARWRAILEGIDAQDEGRVAEPLNSMDEFCDEAIRARDGGPRKGKEAGEVRCHFCLGFPEAGGCLGLVERVNRAVHLRRWSEAREIAHGYLRHLETGDLSGRAAG
jgi:hypothetical protein